MNSGRTVFAQLIEHLPHKEFHKCVTRYRGNRYAKNFSCWDQYLAMVFAQLTYRESLRDIETCMGAVGSKLYHMGLRARVARSTQVDRDPDPDLRLHRVLAVSFNLTANNLGISGSIGNVTVTDTGANQVTVTLTMNAGFSIKLHLTSSAVAGWGSITPRIVTLGDSSKCSWKAIRKSNFPTSWQPIPRALNDRRQNGNQEAEFHPRHSSSAKRRSYLDEKIGKGERKDQICENEAGHELAKYAGVSGCDLLRLLAYHTGVERPIERYTNCPYPRSLK